jgi:hypothetical protein
MATEPENLKEDSSVENKVQNEDADLPSKDDLPILKTDWGSDSPSPSKQDNEKDKSDPMMELMDDLNAFVSQVNNKITDMAKNLGKEAWGKLQDTEPMKKVNGAMDDAKDFLNNKVDEGIDSAKSFANDIKDKITSSFNDLMQFKPSQKSGKSADDKEEPAQNENKQDDSEAEQSASTTEDLGSDAENMDMANFDTGSVASLADGAAPGLGTAIKVVETVVELAVGADTSKITDLVKGMDGKAFDGMLSGNDAAVTSSMKKGADQAPEEKEEVSSIPQLKA